MPTSADTAGRVSNDAGEALFDTSAAVPLVLEGHPAQAALLAATRGWRRGLAGHARFETYSVLTRLPGGQRRSTPVIGRLLGEMFPATRYLDERSLADLADELARLGVSGGSVYDALVGATARAHNLLLVSCDRRAKATYDALGVRVLLVG